MDEQEMIVDSPVFLIETDRIRPNPFQPRRVFDDEQLRELANSIREVGIIQPLVVTKVEQETETGTDVHYELIAGERRWRASQLVGLDRVPAIIKNVTLDRERLEMAIIENVQRAQLNPIEAARAYAKLQDQFGLTQREIAVRIGKSRESVANTMRLLNLPTVVQDAISNGSLSEGQARLLLTVDDIRQQEALLAAILRDNLSVRAIRLKINQLKGDEKLDGERSMHRELPPDLQRLQSQLEEWLGTKVTLAKSGQAGKMVIEFYSAEDLSHLMERLRPHDQNIVSEPQHETEVHPQDPYRENVSDDFVV